MKRYKIIGLLIFVLAFTVDSFAQANQNVEMADVLRRDGKIYTVVVGLVLMLTVMIIFLIRIERKLSKMENNK